MKTDTTEIQDGETRFNHIGKGANTAFHIIFILLSILCLAPLVFVIIISFSSEHSVMVNGYSFRPDECPQGPMNLCSRAAARSCTPWACRRW